MKKQCYFLVTNATLPVSKITGIQRLFPTKLQAAIITLAPPKANYLWTRAPSLSPPMTVTFGERLQVDDQKSLLSNQLISSSVCSLINRRQKAEKPREKLSENCRVPVITRERVEFRRRLFDSLQKGVEITAGFLAYSE